MTADPTALRLLAEEVEKLTGPSREVALRIHQAMEWLRSGVRPAMPADEDIYGEHPHVTRSIDAAAALMPDGWRDGVERCPFSGSRQRRWEAVADRGEFPMIVAAAATEPLARTACALRAIAAEMEGRNAEAV